MRQYHYSLGMRFKQVADLNADRPAIRFDSTHSISYRELDRSAAFIAGLLQQHGVVLGSVVCIAGHKTVDTYATILACLSLGAPYVILDPDSPIKRIQKILTTCRPRLMLADPALLKQLAETIDHFGITTAPFAVLTLQAPDACQSQRSAPITGTTPAYIMYTSGSTGVPKGAVMTHANVLNLIAWGQDTFGITCGDTLTNLNPLYFDNSVFDFYVALFSGACLVPFGKEEVRDPRLLVDKVAATGCTVWFSVPSLLIFLQTMRATNGRNLSGIRSFIFGGEGYPKSKLKQLYDLYKGSSRFFNVYGPTECTCICSAYQISDSDFEYLQGLPPLGSLADNFHCLILDEDGNLVPDGMIGELCLLGPNVGLGYYNDPERSAAAFIQNPLHDNYREIMYRTGDLVHRDTIDGLIYIHGRRDNQVKHMGYRIELEEIEAALHCLENVAEAAVIHSSATGLSRLVAVVALHHDVPGMELRAGLQQIIPDYMVPSEFILLDVLPKNANGKVDRRTLRERYGKSDDARQI